jgi:mono/diheme cytochrome c family protein
MQALRFFSLVAVMGALTACAAATSGGTGGGGATTAAAAAPPDTSAAIIAEGRTLFNGTARCASCHGSNGRGGQGGPQLNDTEWLQINGSYSGIQYIIRNGVSAGDIREPMHQRPMPARGGENINLTDAQIDKIATYVWSLRNAQ